MKHGDIWYVTFGPHKTDESGESKAFNYRVYVHAGDVEKARVADRFANYAEAPAAEIK